MAGDPLLRETDAVVIKQPCEQEKIDLLLRALKRLLSACDAELVEGRLSQKSYARGLARETIRTVEGENSSSGIG